MLENYLIKTFNGPGDRTKNKSFSDNVHLFSHLMFSFLRRGKTPTRLETHVLMSKIRD